MKKPHSVSLSVIIPAFNEEKNIEAAVNTIDSIVKGIFDDYELVIVNDGSADRTAEIANELARKNPKVKAANLPENRGFGAAYREGVMRATKKYLIMIPGDNEILPESIEGILSHTGEADIVMSYTVNKEARPWLRRAVSAMFTAMLNILFSHNLKYYIGMVVYETSLVKNVKMTTDSFAFQAEILIRLLKQGRSYKEVPMRIRPYQGSAIKIFKIRNVIGVLAAIARLFLEIRLRR